MYHPESFLRATGPVTSSTIRVLLFDLIAALRPILWLLFRYAADNGITVLNHHTPAAKAAAQ